MITKALLYCTKNKPMLLDLKGTYELDRDDLWETYNPNDIMNILNGKVVAVCDIEVEEINRLPIPFNHETYIIDFSTNSIDDMEVLIKLSCLSYDQMNKYLTSQKGFSGYAIHIKNLKVFNEPKKINRFKVHWREKDKEVKELFGRNTIAFKWLEKAPQNMCKVYQLSADGEYYDDYALISIQPQWLVKILNGEKTIEVRKKVLKEML